MKTFLKAATIAVMLLPQVAAADADLAEAFTDYLDFATYEDGIIMPAQITKEVWDNVTFIDTRNAEQFAEETIPGAINIEWREIPARIDELPTTGMVVLFCNTGTLSAQATFAARMMGRENVFVLQTGAIGWSSHAGYNPDL